jgi:hypothetical protein
MCVRKEEWGLGTDYQKQMCDIFGFLIRGKKRKKAAK